MKLLQISFHFEYEEVIKDLLDEHQVKNYVSYPLIEGKDCDGKHFGTKVHPGNSSVIQAQVEADQVEPLLAELDEFKQSKPSHYHLQALVLPVENRLT